MMFKCYETYLITFGKNVPFFVGHVLEKHWNFKYFPNKMEWERQPQLCQKII